MALGLLIYFATLVYALFKGERAGDNPWGGVTLEWTVPSPPPREDFERLPTVTGGAYRFPQEGGS